MLVPLPQISLWNTNGETESQSGTGQRSGCLGPEQPRPA